jgi:hypothetical protein
MFEYDKISKWSIQRRGASILRMAGVRDIETWTPRKAITCPLSVVRGSQARTDKEVWTSLTEKAMKIADTVFKGKHPGARMDERHLED